MNKLNINPKGIKAGDCVIRAIAVATEQTWNKVYADLCKIGFKMKRMPNEKAVYEKYLNNLGWIKHKQPRATTYADGRKQGSLKYTVDELCTELTWNKHIGGYSNKIIVSVANHLTCLEWDNVKGFEITDTWDCGYKCVGNYWTKEN